MNDDPTGARTSKPMTATQINAIQEEALGLMRELNEYAQKHYRSQPRCTCDLMSICTRLYSALIKRLGSSSDETEARHLLSCAMVKHPNCTHCDCGSSIDESTRASSGARPDQPHTHAQGILDTASGSVRVSDTDPSGTPQDIGRASGSEVRQAREPNPGSGAPAPGAAERCKCGHSDESHFIGSTKIKGPCIVCSCMGFSLKAPGDPT